MTKSSTVMIYCVFDAASSFLFVCSFNKIYCVFRFMFFYMCFSLRQNCVFKKSLFCTTHIFNTSRLGVNCRYLSKSQIADWFGETDREGGERSGYSYSCCRLIVLGQLCGRGPSLSSTCIHKQGGCRMGTRGEHLGRFTQKPLLPITGNCSCRCTYTFFFVPYKSSPKHVIYPFSFFSLINDDGWIA
ncbi:uncharacterized protein LOC143449063 isoform X2 [Clavelina lepadiformis]|uniref:uncharacterized protein LOC143449063 isoform X2 n=1 Tax=Clavelina lepadiformis TaxID=159417 RepID=UPI0040423D52